jgi:peptide methionine sulfoxide reductase MsrA
MMVLREMHINKIVRGASLGNPGEVRNAFKQYNVVCDLWFLMASPSAVNSALKQAGSGLKSALHSQSPENIALLEANATKLQAKLGRPNLLGAIGRFLISEDPHVTFMREDNLVVVYNLVNEFVRIAHEVLNEKRGALQPIAT